MSLSEYINGLPMYIQIKLSPCSREHQKLSCTYFVRKNINFVFFLTYNNFVTRECDLTVYEKRSSSALKEWG
jgi:hypothetical protein